MFANYKHKLTSWRWLNPVLALIGLALCLVSGDLFATSSATVSWTPSTAANVGGYKLYYGTASRNYTTNVDVGTTTKYQVSGLQLGTTYYFAVAAYDLTKTAQGAYSAESTVATPQPVNFSVSQASGNAPLVVNLTPTVSSAATVASWQWNFGDGVTNSGTTSNVPTAIKAYPNAGSYTVSLTVSGPGWTSTQTKSNLITVTTPPSSSGGSTSGGTSAGGGGTSSGSGSTSTTTSGLVAAYGFDETVGAFAMDSSGTNNYGIITNAVRVSGGRFGNALQYNGQNAWVTVSNSKPLALTTAMTLEAWVYPTTWMNGLSTVVMKEQPAVGTVAGTAAYLLAANNSANQPMSAIFSGSEVTASGNTQIPPNQWTHLASTYDGQYQSLYVNGVLVEKLPKTGAINVSSGVLRIGGSSIWGGYFQGYIDEVRIYNQALSNAQILTDSTTAVSVSNPPQYIVGDSGVEPALASIPAGVAQAYQVVAPKAQFVTQIEVYLDASSTAKTLMAGIYSTGTNGHPYCVLSKSSLTALKAGWNIVPIQPQVVAAGQSYWIVLLGSGGTLQLRSQPGTGTGLMETSSSSTLTALPNAWVTGSDSIYGSVSAYFMGY